MLHHSQYGDSCEGSDTGISAEIGRAVGRGRAFVSRILPIVELRIVFTNNRLLCIRFVVFVESRPHGIVVGGILTFLCPPLGDSMCLLLMLM